MQGKVFHPIDFLRKSLDNVITELFNHFKQSPLNLSNSTFKI